MRSRFGKNNTTDTMNFVDWNDAASLFRIYHRGILYGNTLYKSPIHTLIAILYGDEFFQQQVLQNYDPKFVSQLLFQFCGVPSDSEFVRDLGKAFCILPNEIEKVLDDAIAVLALILFDQRPHLFINVPPRQLTPSIVKFAEKSPLLVKTCKKFLMRCTEHVNANAGSVT